MSTQLDQQVVGVGFKTIFIMALVTVTVLCSLDRSLKCVFKVSTFSFLPFLFTHHIFVP